MTKEPNITPGNNLQLTGFGELEKSEIEVINKLLGKYLRKINNEVNYESFRIRLKQHQKSKSFSHELKAELFVKPGEVIGATIQHKNLYKAFSLLMTKILAVIEHRIKKKQPQHPIRKLSRKVI